MAERRLVGSYPVIGIRPTIDGRRGALDVRGSLEEQTMNMAKSAAKLQMMQSMVLSVLYTLKLTATLYRMTIKIQKRIHTNTLQKVYGKILKENLQVAQQLI